MIAAELLALGWVAFRDLERFVRVTEVWRQEVADRAVGDNRDATVNDVTGGKKAMKQRAASRASTWSVGGIRSGPIMRLACGSW